MYYLEFFDTLPCFDCYILGISWHEVSRTIGKSSFKHAKISVYKLPYAMFIMYLMIVVKIFALRSQAYMVVNKHNRHDQMLVDSAYLFTLF